MSGLSGTTMATIGSLALAFAALVVAVISTRHASRSARAAEDSARSAERSARAEEHVSQLEQHRFDREQDEIERQAEAEEAQREQTLRNARSARLVLRTLRSDRNPPPAFGDDEPFDYWLVVTNEGATKAERVVISNLTCNGTIASDMPACAAEPSELAPTFDLLPNRWWNIRLTPSGPRSTYDLAYADVSWTDGNGQNSEQLPIERRW